MHITITKSGKLCIARQDAQGNWHWDYCPDCGARDAHHRDANVRCG